MTALGHDWRDVPGRSRHHRYCHRCGVRDVETMSTICHPAPYGYPQQPQPGARR